MPRPQVPYGSSAAPARPPARPQQSARNAQSTPAHTVRSLNSTPIRDPDVHNPKEMTYRGWVLFLANLLYPGLAQLLAGSRKLARIGLFASTVLLLAVISAAVLYFNARDTLFNVAAEIATNGTLLFILQIVLIVYIALWIFLTIDTLRLIRIVKTGPRARYIIALITIAALAVTTLSTGYVAQVAGAQRDLLGELFGGTIIAEPIDGRYNILLLGGDAGEDRWGLRPDSITVVSVDAETGQASMIGIPRNLENAVFSEDSPLWQAYPTGYDCGHDCLISFLYTEGITNPDWYPNATEQASDPGIEAMRDAVEGVTGLTLQYYVLIDMAGFEHLIDALGGVHVTVENRVPLASTMDSQGNFLDLQGWIEPGEQHLGGYYALWYARSRVNTSDYDRMQRQRQVQQAILQQFDPLTVISRYQQIADASTATVKTDIPASMLTHFADLALMSRELPVQDLELVPPLVNTGNPDLDQIKLLVEEFLAPPPEPDVSDVPTS